MKALLLLAALLAVAPSVPAQRGKPPKKPTKTQAPKKTTPKVTLNVNAKEGETVVGERVFRVTVQSGSPVTQVEFYVGEDLRDSDTSTPYEFRVDSLAEDDGKLPLTFKAYNQQGETGTKKLAVVINNEVSKGAAYHVERARRFVEESNWDQALVAGRIALKADANSNAARLVLARAYLGKGIMDQAQKFAEDAAAADAKSVEALDLLAGVNLRRAFRTVNTGGDRAETVNTIRSAYKAAATARRKSLDLQVELVGTPTDETLLRYADTAIRAGQYSTAISALRPAFLKDDRRNDVTNRLAYAQVRSGRVADAAETMSQHRRSGGTPDAYGFALISVIEWERGNETASDEAIREAILNDPNDLGVQTAQAYIALKRNRPAVLSKLAADLAKDQGARVEVNYFLSALANRLNQYENGRRYFERALLAEPASYETYIDAANESISIAQSARLEAADVQARYETARALLETALIARDSSHEALTGLALVDLLQNRPADALRRAESAVAAAPGYAAAHYALAAALTANRRNPDAMAALRKAGEADPKRLEGQGIPGATDVWRYFATWGRTPVLTPPK